MFTKTIAVDLTWQIAAAEAVRSHHQFIEPEHLFIGLFSLNKILHKDGLRQFDLDKSECLIAENEIESLLWLFHNFGVNPDVLRKQLRELLGIGIIQNVDKRKEAIHRSAKSRQLFNLAEELAHQTGDTSMTILHLLAALLSDANGLVVPWLRKKGLKIDKLSKAAISSIGSQLETDSGSIVSEIISNEFEPPKEISEKEFAEIHYRLIQISAQSQGQALLERCLDEIRQIFPQADQGTLLLIEDDGEPAVRVSWPQFSARVSFTLVRKAIRLQMALQWMEESGDAVQSVFDTTSALYAPVLYGGRVIGVLNVGITSRTGAPFTDIDLQRLSVVANTVGLAIQAGNNVRSSLPRHPWVFISYAHKDNGAAKRLTGDLRRQRVKVWLDEQLPVGENWREQLALAIEQTDAFIVMLSPDSVCSEYVLWEIETARLAKKKIIPIYHRTCEPPADIAAIQYVDIRTDYDGGLYQLARALNSLPLLTGTDYKRRA